MTFDVIGQIEHEETIASGRGVKARAYLQKIYSRSRWRKRKGVATVRLGNGQLRRVELHRYESLILGKVYRIVPDARTAKDDLVRVIDESGEDCLFARNQFAFVKFPQPVRRKILALQKAG